MFGMSQDQLMGLLRQLLPLIGGLFVGLGWISPTFLSHATEIILQVAGPLSIIVGVIWSAIANSKASILTSAAKMPEVKSIVVADTPTGNDLADATARPEVVVK